MTLEELRRKVNEWDTFNNNNESIANSKYTTILTHLEYHANNEWKEYLPVDHPDYISDYMERLARWIGNVQIEDEQKLLLEYALHISFFSHADFTALYRTALQREVYPWIAKNISANLDTLGAHFFDDIVANQVNHRTWFCPVTDSMDINEFYKVNHISGISHKPQFATLQTHAEDTENPNLQIIEDWKRYMIKPNVNNPQTPSLDYLVLLEDIVGSGSQCKKTVKWAVSSFEVPVLFIPLILCPNGVDAMKELELECKGKLIVRPIVKLERGDILGPERKNVDGWSITDSMESFANKYAYKVGTNISPFGYKDTGCSIATFSNTPDNTLPLIHRKHLPENWEALFPRVYRD
jgi:hypothetical protein